VTIRTLLAVALAVLVSAVARADNWPNWRGPANNGICNETGLPASFGESKNLLWKLPLPGKGSSTPIIWGDRIFLTASENRDLILLCAGTNGKVLWKRKLATETKAVIRKDESNEASASASTDGKHVFAYVATGDLACLDFEGNQVWKINIQQKYGAFSIQHGMHVTPLLTMTASTCRSFTTTAASRGPTGSSPSTRQRARKCGRRAARAMPSARAARRTPPR
jgi:outer membrane protein assembly factor BamB